MRWFAILVAVVFCAKNYQVFGLTGGQPAEEGEFPFMVSIRTTYGLCGGTILSDRWVLTSNMCYAASWGANVSYGSSKLDINTTTTNHIRIDDVLYNPWAEDRTPWTHDLVLVHLSRPLPLGEKVQPVKLPELDEPWPDNQKATTLGWGLEEGPDRHASVQTNLQKAEIQLYSNEYCGDTSRWNGWLPDFIVMKCGGEVNKTFFCGNDVGGPLLYNSKQIGIASYIYYPYGGICGSYLNIYSPVAYFRQWIKDTTDV